MSTVADIFDSVEITNTKNLYPALNRAVRLVAKRLRWHRSDIITGALSVTVAADAAYGSLPTDFWGLMQRPYINGKTWELKPLPTKETALTYTSVGIPRYYAVKGSSIYVYPSTSAEITLNGDYFQRPTKLTKPTDTMPYSELFDDAIADYLVGFADNSLDPNILTQSVDDIIPHRDRGAGEPFVEAINWDYD